MNKYSKLIKHFFSTAINTTEGKLLTTIWGSYLGVILLSKATTKKIRKNKEKSNNNIYQLLKLFQNKIFTIHLLYLFIYVMVLASRTFITVKMTNLIGKLSSLMGTRDWNRMFTNQFRISLLFFPAALCNALMKIMEKRVSWSIRTIL